MKHLLKEQKGFTLIELIIVLVISGILAAVAIPAYTRYLTDATAAEAEVVIGALAAAEKAARQQTGSFTTLAYTNNAWVTIGSVQIDTAEGPSFEYQITSPDSDNFTITARGIDSGLDSGDTLSYSYNAVGTPRASWSATGRINAP